MEYLELVGTEYNLMVNLTGEHGVPGNCALGVQGMGEYGVPGNCALRVQGMEEHGVLQTVSTEYCKR
jgi:hypothetical protein